MSTKVVGDIAIDVTADVGPLVRSMGKGSNAVSALGRQTEKVANGLNNFGNATQKLGRRLSFVSAGMLVAGGAAFAMVKGTAASAREIDRLSQVSNSSSGDFQRMAAGAKTVGIEQEKLADILKDVNDRIGDFMTTGGGPMADFFENIAPKVGVTADQFARLSGPEALQLYVSSLEKAGVSQQEMTFYMEAMASDATALIPLLKNGGAEMKRLGEAAAEAGSIMDEKSIAAGKRFETAMDDMQNAMQGVKDQFAVTLMPVMSQLVEVIGSKVIPAAGEVVKRIQEWVAMFQDLPGPVQEAAAVIGMALGAGGPILLAIGTLSKVMGALVLATGPIGLFIAAAALLTAAWVQWGDDIKLAVGGAVDWVAAKFESMLEFVRGIPGQMREIGANIITGLKEGIVEKWEEFKAYLHSLLMEIPEWARDLLDIQSPSKVFHEIGAQIGAGLTDGIASATSDVEAAIAAITGKAKAGAENTASVVLGSMQQMFSKSKPIAAAIALVNTMQGATEALKLPFPANLGAFAQVVATGMGAISAIKGASKGGGGGGGVSAPAAAAPNMSSRVALTLVGSENSMFSKQQVRSLINQINEATEDGALVRLA